MVSRSTHVQLLKKFGDVIYKESTAIDRFEITQLIGMDTQ